MFSALKVTNFQGFMGQQEVKLAPITLIFGPNASGKSSIIRAIQLYQQSVENQTSESAFFGISYDGKYLKIPALKDLQFGQIFEESAPLSDLGLAVGVSKPLSWKKTSISSATLEVGNLEAGEFWPTLSRPFSTLTFKTKAGATLSVTNVAPSSTNEDATLEKLRMKIIELENGSPSQTDAAEEFRGILEFLETQKLSRLEISWSDDSQLFKEFLASADVSISEGPVSEEYEQAFVAGFSQLIVSWSVAYASQPLTGVPDFKSLRQYIGALPSSSLSADIKNFVEQIAEAYESAIGDFYNAELLEHVEPIREIPARTAQGTAIGLLDSLNSEAYAEANRWLKVLTNDRYTFSVRRHPLTVDDQGDGGTYLGDVTVREVHDRFTEVSIPFNQVGIGLSQVLPVLIKAFALDGTLGTTGVQTVSRGDILLIEQPEIHLHPRMQADAAEMLLVAQRQTERQFIIETHSENMLLRFQKLIRTGQMAPEELEIVYVEPIRDDPDDDGVPGTWYNYMRNLRIDESGDVLDPFPISFADLRVQDLLF